MKGQAVSSMKREFLWVSPLTGTVLRSISCSGDHGTGRTILPSWLCRMASTSDDHSTRSPTRTRSESSSQATASRHPVMVTIV